MIRIKSSCVGVIALLLCVCAGCQTASKNGLRVSGFTNFGTVYQGVLYRGDAPRSEADIAYLSQLGVRTIIDLREGGAGDGDLEQEQAWIARVNAGNPGKTIRWVNFPCDAFKPGDVLEHFRAFLAQKNLPEDQGGLAGPFFVHCQYGRDRTGLWVAAYRISQGGDPIIAANEMRDFGQNFIVLPGLYDFVKRQSKSNFVTVDAMAQAKTLTASPVAAPE